jgi:hypothetical protein
LKKDKDGDKDKADLLEIANKDLAEQLKKRLEDRRKMLADLAALEKLNGDLG